MTRHSIVHLQMRLPVPDIIIYITKVAVCVFVCLSRTFTFTIVTLTQVLVQTYTTGVNNNSATLPVSQLEQGGTWHHLSSIY